MKSQISLLVLFLLPFGAGKANQDGSAIFSTAFGDAVSAPAEPRQALLIDHERAGTSIIDNSRENTDSLVIVAFGNSITATRKTVNQVFAQRLPGLLAERGVLARVINSGIPGSHTGRLADNRTHKVRHASDRFESDVLSYQPDLVIIGFGTNDSFIDSRKAGGLSRIPLHDYRKNLTYFIETLQGKNSRVILIAPNPLGKGYENFQNDRLLQYVLVVRQLAERYQTGLVDNFWKFNEYAGQTGQSIDALLLDGCHPNDKGHKIIAEGLVRAVLELMVPRKSVK